jgi:hypothetical protein
MKYNYYFLLDVIIVITATLFCLSDNPYFMIIFKYLAWVIITIIVIISYIK